MSKLKRVLKDLFSNLGRTTRQRRQRALRNLLLETLEERRVMASITSVGSLDDNANVLRVQYAHNPATTPLTFKVTKSADAIASTEDSVALTLVVSNHIASPTAPGAFALDFTADLSILPNEYLIITVSEGANLADSKVFQNDFLVTSQGGAYIFGSTDADTLVIGHDVGQANEVGKFTFKSGNSQRTIHSPAPLRSFQVSLYEGDDLLSSTIDSVLASTLIRQTIRSGAGADTITVNNTNVTLEGDDGVDILIVQGTSLADTVDVSSQGVMLGGEKRTTLTSVERIEINTMDGDDVVTVNSLPAGVTPLFIVNPSTGAVTTHTSNDFTVQMDGGRDTLKFGGVTNGGNPATLPWPRILGVEVLDLSGLSLSRLTAMTTGGPDLLGAFFGQAERDRLEELDLRYNQLNLADASGLALSWSQLRSFAPKLKTLLLHGNLNQETANLNGLAGLWYYIDLPPVGVQQAENQATQSAALSSLVAALHYNPLKIFEYVRNKIEFEPYYGRKKSPLSVIQSRKANDYDMANLLKELFLTVGIGENNINFAQTKSESGSYLYMDYESIRNWLGTMAADDPLKESGYYILRDAYQPLVTSNTKRVDRNSEATDPKGIYFDHTWLQVNVGNTVYRLNPAIKTRPASSAQQLVLDALNVRLNRNYASFGELLVEQVPLNPIPLSNNTSYISPLTNHPDAYYTTENGEIRNYSPLEWYERRVNRWLAENAPGVSLGDVRHQIPILAKQIKSTNDLWPENVQFAQRATNESFSHTTTPAIWLLPESRPEDYWQIQIQAKHSPTSTNTWWTVPPEFRTTEIDQSELYVGLSYQFLNFEYNYSSSQKNAVYRYSPILYKNGSPVTISPNYVTFTGHYAPAQIPGFSLDVEIKAPQRLRHPSSGGFELMQSNSLARSSVNAVEIKASSYFDGQYFVTTASLSSNVMAVSVDAGHVSEQFVSRQQLLVNDEQIEAVRQSGSASPATVLTNYGSNELGSYLTLVGLVYRRNMLRDRAAIGALFGTPSFVDVNVGFVSGEQNVYAGNIRPDKLYPLLINGLAIDLPNETYILADIHANETALGSDGFERDLRSPIYRSTLQSAFALLMTHSSALEHMVIEELTDTDAYSTVKLLQYARKNNLQNNNEEIFEFNSKSEWNLHKTVYPAGSNNVTMGLYASIDKLYASTDINQHPEVLFLPKTNRTVAANRAVYPASSNSSWVGNGFLAVNQHISNYRQTFGIYDNKGFANGGYTSYFSQPAIPVTNHNFAAKATVVADPINPLTGAFFDDVVDINLPSIGLPLHFSRHYDSLTASLKADLVQDPNNRRGGLRDLGDGWWHNYSDRLDIKSTTVDWITSQGQVFTITAPASSNLDYVVPKSLKGQFWKQVSGSTTTYHYRDRSGLEREFDHRGKLAKIRDQFGNMLALTYDPALGVDPYSGGLLKSVTSIPNTSAFNEDSDQTPPIGTSYDMLLFEYAVSSGLYNKKISQVKVAKYDPVLGATSVEEGVLFTTTYTSDTSRYRLTRAESRFAQVEYFNGISNQRHRTDYAYHEGGNYSPTFNKLKSITKFNDANDSTSVSAVDYYANGRVFRVTDPTGNRQHFTYDQSRLQTIFVDENQNATRYYFDDQGHDIGTRFADGSRTSKNWSSDERLLSEQDEGNIRKEYVYSTTSPYDHIKEIRTQEYTRYYDTSTGNPTWTTLFTENFTYTDLFQSRPTSQGATTNRLLVSQMDRSTTREDSGALVTLWYEYAPNLISTLAPLLARVLNGVQTHDGTLNGNLVSAETTTNYTRSPNGLVNQQFERLWDPILSINSYSTDTAPLLSEERFFYNRAGLITRQVSRVPNDALSPGYQEITQKFRYNPIGKLEKTIDGEGVESVVNTLDPIGNVLSATWPATSAATTNLAASTHSYRYNRRGNVVRSIDALGRTTRFGYDGNQRQINQTLPDSSVMRSIYDGMGNVVYQTDYLGRVVQNIYDSRNRLIQTIQPDGTTQTMTYDGRGNRTGTTQYVQPDGYLDESLTTLTQAFTRETTTDYNRFIQPTKVTTTGANGQDTNPWVKIPIANNSFETLPAGLSPLGDGSATVTRSDIPGWTGTASILNPKALSTNVLTATDPAQGHFAYRGAAEQRYGLQIKINTAYQTLVDAQNQNAPVTLQPNTTYLLEVDVGRPTGGEGRYLVSLYAGSTFLGQVNHNQVSLSPKEYSRVVLTYATTATPDVNASATIPSGALRIYLSDLSLSEDPSSAGTVFDNVRLWKRSTIDLDSTETHFQYTVTGQLTSTVDSRTHISPWQNAANAFDVNNDGAVNGSDYGPILFAASGATASSPYGATDLLPRQKFGVYYPDINGDGSITQSDYDALTARLASFSTDPSAVYNGRMIDPVNGVSLKYDRLGRVIENTQPNGIGLSVAPTEVTARQTDPNVVATFQPDGNQVAWSNSSQASSELTQTVGINFANSTSYELQVDVGYQSRYSSGIDYELAKFTVELWAGNTLVASRNQSQVSLVRGAITTISVLYTTPYSGLAGYPLKIRLTSNNQVVGGRVFFDNVRLTATQNLSSPLAAAPVSIAIVNPSFEADSFSGTSNMNATITGWTSTGIGLFKPTPGDFTVPAPVWKYGYNRPTDARLSLTLVPRASVSVVQDPLGRLTVSTVDGRGRDRSGVIMDSAGNVVQSTTRTFDKADRMITSVSPLGYQTGNTPTTFTTAYTYDARGQLFEVNAPDTTGPNGETLTHVSRNSYDQVGNQTLSGEFNGSALNAQTQTIFDSRNRAIEVRRRIQISPSIVDQTVKTAYDRNGNVVQTTDPLGRIQRTVYDTMDRPTIAFNALGSALQTQYTSTGLVLTQSDYAGNLDYTFYDRRDQAVLNYDPASDLATYSVYDTAGQVIGQTSGRAEVNSIVTGGEFYTLATPRTTQYAYDRLGRRYLTVLPQVKVPDTGGSLVDGTPRLLVGYDLLGNKVVQYDPRGVTSAPSVVGAITGDSAYATRYTYDALNRLLTKTLPLLEAGNPAAGRPVWQYRYDAASNVLVETDPRGFRTAHSYDNASLRRTTRVYSSQATTPLTTTTDDYDNRGNLVKVVDGDNIATNYSYDLLNRLTKKDGQDVTVNSAVQTREWLTVYDAAGNVTSTTDPLGRITVTTYDGLNRPVLTQLPSGGVNSYLRRTVQAYDVNGNLLRTTDGIGNVHRYNYDAANRQTESIEPRAASETLDRKTSFSYDVFSNLLMLEDPSGVKQVFKYDSLDRRIEDGQVVATGVGYDEDDRVLTGIIDDSGVNPQPQWNVRWRRFSFDAAGNLVRSTDRNGRVIQYQYDLLNQNILETWHATSGQSASQTFTRKYDLNGQLTELSDLNNNLQLTSTLQYDYDYAGRATLDVTEVAGGTQTDILREYSPAGLPSETEISVDDPNSSAIVFDRRTYIWDAAGRLDNLSSLKLFGSNPTSILGPALKFAYNAADQTMRVDRHAAPNMQALVKTDLVYESYSERLSQIQHRVIATDALLNQWNLSYDRQDRIVVTSSTTDATTLHSYDARDQLMGSDRNGTVNDETFAYSTSGNRTSRILNGITVTTTYGNAFQQNRLQNDGVYTYSYDNEGNVVTKLRTGATNEHITYQWDNRNRLVSVVYRATAGASTTLRQANMRYDGLDRLVQYTIDVDGSEPQAARSENYIYDGQQMYLMVDGEMKLRNRYLSGPAVDQVLMDQEFTYDANNVRTGQLRHLLADHQGSIRTVTDQAGAVLQRMRYNAFGELISAVDTTPSTTAPASSLNGGGLTPTAVDSLFRYTGRPYFNEIDLQNSRARWYDAEQGRFLSTDPSGYSGGGDYNLYRYVANNPVNMTDPSGLQGHRTQALPSSVSSAAPPALSLQDFTSFIGSVFKPFVRAAAPLVNSGISALGPIIHRGQQMQAVKSFAQSILKPFVQGVAPLVNSGISAAGQIIQRGQQSAASSYVPQTAMIPVPNGSGGYDVIVPESGLPLNQTSVDRPSMRAMTREESTHSGKWERLRELVWQSEHGGFDYRNFDERQALSQQYLQERGLLPTPTALQQIAEVGQDVAAAFAGVRTGGTSGSLARPSNAPSRTASGFEPHGFNPPPGTRQIPQGIPDGWRIRPTQGEGGVWYYDPANKGNAVRVMPGDPASPFPNSQVPYVRWQRNGQPLDVNGNVLPTKKSPDAHIPLPDFRFDGGLFQ